MTHSRQYQRFGCEVTRKDGELYLASGRDNECNLFRRRADAREFAKTIKPMISIHSRIRVVPIRVRYDWGD